MINTHKRIRNIVCLTFVILTVVFIFIKAQTPIKAVNNDNIKHESVTYYISKNGNSQLGTKIDDPMSLDNALKRAYYSNDKILFKAGDIFYKTINFKIIQVKNSKLYIGSYGDGKAIIDGSKVLINVEAWRIVDKERNVYSLDLNEKNFFEGYEDKSNNIGFFMDSKGTIYGNRKSEKNKLKNDGDFYIEDGILFLKLSSSPKNLGKIKICTKNTLVRVESNTELDNLQIQNTGAHGITQESNAENIYNVYIHNCVIKNIGGSTLIEDNQEVRFGNGIEFSTKSSNINISENLISNTFDAGITLQSHDETDYWNNVTIQNNIIYKCEFSIEIWSYGPGFEKCEVKNNIMIMQGYGWSNDVRIINTAANIVVYALEKKTSTDINLNNNIIILPRATYYISDNNKEKAFKGFNYNDYYVKENQNKSYMIDYNLEKKSKFNYVEIDEKNIENDKIIDSDSYNEAKMFYLKWVSDYDFNETICEVINKTKKMYEDNIEIFNKSMKEEYNKIINELSIVNNNTNVEEINKLISMPYSLIELWKRDDTNDDKYEKMVNEIIEITSIYKNLNSKYFGNNQKNNEDIKNEINQLIDKYNKNADIALTREEIILSKVRELYNGLTNESTKEDYVTKAEINELNKIAEKILDEDIKNIADSDFKNITTYSNIDLNKLTNQDVIIIIHINSKNSYVKDLNGNKINEAITFNKNETKQIILNIRGYDYTYTIKVNNIDKTVPKVTAENGQSLKINVTDDNLKEIKIEKDGKETVVNNGQTITTPGIYKITATDKAGNSTNKTAIVYGTYTNEQNTKVNYVTIKSKTKVSDVKQDGDYTIKDNNNTTAGVKRAPSRVNTNTEKDSNSYIATGDVLQENNNTYIIITIGDLSSNGDVGVADLIKLRKSLIGLTKLTKLQELAADTNQSGSVNVSDLLEERKIMVGME